jgi:pentatricopeptide repeat protein
MVFVLRCLPKISTVSKDLIIVLFKLKASDLHYEACLKAYVRCGKLDDTIRTLEEMRKLGMLSIVRPVRGFMFTFYNTPDYKIIKARTRILFKDLLKRIDEVIYKDLSIGNNNIKKRKVTDKLSEEEKAKFWELIAQLRSIPHNESSELVSEDQILS